MKQEFFKVLNQIEKYLKEEQYDEAKKYIKRIKLELNMRENDIASDYIDDIISKLNT